MRTKLISVLVLPLGGFLLIAGVQVDGSVRSATTLDDYAEQVSLGREVTMVMHELQRERDRTVGLLASAPAPGRPPTESNVEDLSPEWTAVDRAVVALDAAVRPALDRADIAATYRAAEVDLGKLADLRAGVKAGWYRQQAVFDQYSQTIAAVERLLPTSVAAAGDQELSRAVAAFTNLTRAKELTARIRGYLYAVCVAKGFGPGEFAIAADARAQRAAALGRFRAEAGAGAVNSYDDAVAGQAVQNAARLEQAVMDSAAAADFTVNPNQWWLASTTALEQMRSAEVQLLAVAAGLAAERSDDQWRMTVSATAGTLALLFGALLASLFISRNMATNLNQLRDHALEVAHRQLPDVIDRLRTEPKTAPSTMVEPVAIRASDEIGEVAEAFVAVHSSAVRLAAEQAQMRSNVDAIFVNLARRSQTLVERQLRLLDRLELSETDPDQLDNLFSLDHLATRMRRNDENLLVLAGGNTPRRWADPVTLVSVVLAATAEIEKYQRVRHDVADDLAIVGHAVADLVHLVAELLENATIFSPSDTEVTVLGWAATGGAELVIQDRGMGMTADAVARANKQLAQPVNIDVATAERMGLVVVGHLAQRHGVAVSLRSGTEGLEAVVQIPEVLLAPAPPIGPDPADLDSADCASSTCEPSSSDSTGRDETGDDDAIGGSIDERQAATPDSAPRSRPRPTDDAVRRVPTRAEDVIAGRGGAGIWWSDRGASGLSPASVPASARRSAPKRSTKAAKAPTGRARVPASASATVAPPPIPAVEPPASDAAGVVESGGLPVRTPMAHLPTDQLGAAGSTQPFEADPAEVAETLSRLAGGVRRAAAETDGDERRSSK